MRYVIKTSVVCLAAILLSCKKAGPADETPFENVPVLMNVQPGVIDEASGIADSDANPGFLWVELDSGNPPVLHLLKHDGTQGNTVFLKGATNRDWEDIALSSGPGDGKKYLYVGEIGDNASVYPSYSIYRFPEPAASIDTLTEFDKIDFKYPDGSHDAEALFVDANTKDIYIITKRDQFSKLYKLPFPQQTTSLNTASFVMDLPYKGVVSAALSVDQTELLIKTYGNIYYYKRNGGESFQQLLQHSYQTLPYQIEPQGEAICFSRSNYGFYTLSEKGFAPAVKLNFYRRK